MTMSLLMIALQMEENAQGSEGLSFSCSFNYMRFCGVLIYFRETMYESTSTLTMEISGFRTGIGILTQYGGGYSSCDGLTLLSGFNRWTGSKYIGKLICRSIPIWQHAYFN